MSCRWPHATASEQKSVARLFTVLQETLKSLGGKRPVRHASELTLSAVAHSPRTEDDARQEALTDR